MRLATAIDLRVPGSPYWAHAGRQAAVGAHRIDCVEIIAIASGEGRRDTQNPDGSIRSDALLPGQMYLFRPTDVHELRSVSTEPMTILDVAFPVATWAKFVDMAELDGGWATAPIPPMSVVDLNQPEIAAAFRKVLARFHSTPRVVDLIEFLAVVVPLLIPVDPVDTAPGAPAWLRQVLSAMTEEENLRGGVPRLTELAHVSTTHIWRTTRRYLGLSPTELVLGLQLRHAASLLRATDASIASIGERCGFSSASYFSNAFRRYHLITPRAYRDRARRGAPPDGE
jgi:AraC family cel operon transcriptional repressor